MEECIIILPTHSDYKDVCEDFIKLYHKNWIDCKYKLIISVCGKKITFENIQSVYCGYNATLLDCVRIAKEKYLSEIYMVFLGDAFLSSTINNKEVEFFIKEMKKYHISYCRLKPKIMKSKEIRLGKMFRKLNVKDRYSHCFIAFACTPNYIEKEMLQNKTDFEFENKYLIESINAKSSYFYDDHVMLKKNIFHVLPGIEKGRWNRVSLWYLKIKNPNIKFCRRKKITITWQIYLILRDLAILVMPEKGRRFLKNVLNSNLFSTEN